MWTELKPIDRFESVIHGKTLIIYFPCILLLFVRYVCV